MSKIKELISLLQKDDVIVRFKELEKIIDHNKSIEADFNQLLDIQKRMVQAEYKKSSHYPRYKEEYDKQRQIIENYPIIDEYLDLLDIINNDLSIIKTIIEEEIAKDFD